MAKFLVIRLSSIGDIVLTTPVVRCLKMQVDNAEVHFLTKNTYAQIVEYNPYIDKVWLYNNDMPSLLRELKNENFDFVIDLHHNLRTFRIKNHLRALAFSYNKINLEKWLLVNFNINRLPKRHIVDRYLDTVAIFDVKNDGQGLDYFTGPEDETLPLSVSSGLPKDYIALCIGAQHFTKRATAEKLADFCTHSTLPVIILGGMEDRAQADKIINLTTNKGIINLAGKLSLNKSALVVKKSALVVTHDTGLMHIAAAYRKRIFSIWGNTIPEFGMSPYLPGDGSSIFEVKGLSCRPCSKIGFQQCPKEHFKCIMDLDFVKIAEISRD